MTEEQKKKLNDLFVIKSRQEQKVSTLLQQEDFDEAIKAFSLLLGTMAAIGNTLNLIKEPIMDEEE